MVVGRRRVAAASVATAYALHIYVLPRTVFDLPDRLSRLFRLIPHCRKVGVHPSSGYFSWVLVPHPYFPRVLSLYSSPTCLFLSKSTTTLLALKSSYTYAECRATSRNPPSFVQLYPRLSIHCSRILLLLRWLLYLFRSYQLLVSVLSQCPIPELK